MIQEWITSDFDIKPEELANMIIDLMLHTLASE